MNTPLFLGVIFSAAVITLPNYSPGIADDLLFGIIGLVFLLPFVFQSKISAAASLFFENNHLLGKKLLSLHGMIFLAIFQTSTLLWAIDYLLPQFFNEAHNVVLIAITVIAGLTAVAGSAAFIHIVSRTAASILLGIVLLLLVNTIFFHYQLFVFLDPSFVQNGVVTSSTAMLSLNSVSSIIALGIITFWMTWLEMSEVDRKNGMKGRSMVVYKMIGAAVAAAGIFLFMLPKFFGAFRNGNTTDAPLGLLISMGAAVGLIGMFIATIASVGSLFAFRFYPQFTQSVWGEKQKLMNKLAIVFSVIASVLLIPIERTAGSEVVVWYVTFLAMFTSPIVIAFVLSVIVKKQQPFILSFSMMLGGLSAALDFLMNLLFGSGIVDGANIFSLSISGAVVTAASYAVISAMKELVVVQRVLSRMNHS